MMGMFPSSKALLILVVLTTIVFSDTIITHPVLSPAAAQGQQYSFLAKWGSEGIGFGKFRQPLEIAIDSDNDLYVTDTTSLSNQIQKFATNGTFITSWGSTGLGDSQFISPGGIAVDSSDNVYVGDFGQNNRIQKFVSNGNFLG